MTNRICEIADCDKPTRSPRADLCAAHYIRWYRRGDPTWQAPRQGKDIAGQRFGSLTAVRPVASEGWDCMCDCGGRRTAQTFALTVVDHPTCGASLHQRERYVRLIGEPRGQKSHARVCERCDLPFMGWKATRFCGRSCAALARAGSARTAYANSTNREYRARASAAPGLIGAQRTKLRAKWVRQSRQCAYCPSRADTIDHVLPLVRGGTNWEGNLVPCCRSCNSSKAGKTVIEWRHRPGPTSQDTNP